MDYHIHFQVTQFESSSDPIAHAVDSTVYTTIVAHSVKKKNKAMMAVDLRRRLRLKIRKPGVALRMSHLETVFKQ